MLLYLVDIERTFCIFTCFVELETPEPTNNTLNVSSIVYDTIGTYLLIYHLLTYHLRKFLGRFLKKIFFSNSQIAHPMTNPKDP